MYSEINILLIYFQLENYPVITKKVNVREKNYVCEKLSKPLHRLATPKITSTIVIAAKLLIYHVLTLEIRVIPKYYTPD